MHKHPGIFVSQKMNYEREIIRILTEAGSKGLTPTKISRHVYNASNTFFSETDYDDVHRATLQFLKRNSRFTDSIIEKVDRGTYRMNVNSAESRQLMLQFIEDVPEPVKPPTADLSLSLFD